MRVGFTCFRRRGLGFLAAALLSGTLASAAGSIRITPSPGVVGAGRCLWLRYDNGQGGVPAGRWSALVADAAGAWAEAGPPEAGYLGLLPGGQVCFRAPRAEQELRMQLRFTPEGDQAPVLVPVLVQPYRPDPAAPLGPILSRLSSREPLFPFTRQDVTLGSGTYGWVMPLTTVRGERVAAKAFPRYRYEGDTDLARAYRAALERETECHRRLDHPNIIRFFRASQDEHCHFIIMELAPARLGDELERLRRSAAGPALNGRVREWAWELLNALDHLHGQGYLHGDLKVANLLVGRDGRLKLADFGGALPLAGGRAAVAVDPCGYTPRWVAPERARGETFGAKTDVWSFGCVVLEMLTGPPPYTEIPFTSPQEVVPFVAGSDRIPALPEGLPVDLVRLLHRCLVRDPAQRADVKALMVDPCFAGLAPISAGAGPALGLETGAEGATAPPLNPAPSPEALFILSQPPRVAEFHRVTEQTMAPTTRHGLEVWPLATSDGGILAAKVYPKKVLEAGTAAARFFFPALTVERAALRSVDHPNIIRYFGDGQDSLNHYLFVEYAPGSVAQVLADTKASRDFGGHDARLRRHARECLEALEHLHGRGLVHGKLRADNLLLSKDDKLKLSGFSNAYQLVEGKVSAELVRYPFTLCTAAPEQVEGKGFSDKADIWSFGCALLQLATLRNPWADHGCQDPEQLLALIRTPEATPTIPEGLPDGLAGLIKRCLVRDPDQRPDARTLLEDRYFQGPAPIPATPPGTASSLGRLA